MHHEHVPYNHGRGGHGYLEYFRHKKHALVVLGYHMGREWSPLLELTVYPSRKFSPGKARDLKLGPVEIHVHIGLGMCELLVGLKRHGALY
jgi:hypothetical protein